MRPNRYIVNSFTRSKPWAKVWRRCAAHSYFLVQRNCVNELSSDAELSNFRMPRVPLGCLLGCIASDITVDSAQCAPVICSPDRQAR